jgi:arsenate reductase
VPDPAAAEGSEAERRRVFESVAMMLRQRIDLMLALPLDKLDRLASQRELRAIGSPEATREQ